MINLAYPHSAHYQFVREYDMEEFLRDMFPFAKIPHSCKDMKKLIKDLGLGYDKIHSCPNDCMLYWGDRKNQQSCHVCSKSRWMNMNTEDVNEDEDSESMRWHHDQRIDDGLLRHPTDSLSWKSFDSKFPSFATDPRNVRLRLASDGFNPYKIMSTSYSTWPVVLVPYNLPSWICMEQSSFILSMIILGEKGPENDIDIYMQPFIKELKQLWAGVETYDVLRKENFYLRAALLWTINDFPAYANLSSWSTKGRYACPCCAVQTCLKWLYNGKKCSYMGHHRWLDGNHRFRFQRSLFDGTEEFREAPEKTIGYEILQFDDEFDEEDDPNEADLWKKRILSNGKYKLPPSIFAMSKKEKEVFCTVLKDIKVTSCIIELSNIMKAICGKVLNVEELEKVQDRAALNLCNLEKIFPPSFFTIMVHLVWSGKDVNDELKWLSQGPNRVVKRYSAFLINGFRFHTKSCERLRRTQNCGIVVNSSIKCYASARDSNLVEGNVEYYGLLTDIIELDYYGKQKVVLFRCDWADVNTSRGIKKDQFGFTMVNFSRLTHTGQQLIDEPGFHIPSTRPCLWLVSFTWPRHTRIVPRVQKPGHSVYDVIMHLRAHDQDTRSCAKPCPSHG
ncbi:hypothetical protein CXB51_034590 [Gossypium anomalum]|uniref:DUF4216 domain-containing protein n=1 Tax=Gossypium anomalum TaxID=47600 RepID=A0A8J5Y6A8_9ROSI|nr:hypothetical protein CXB51_034590 [Gossypium anomalum]